MYSSRILTNIQYRITQILHSGGNTVVVQEGSTVVVQGGNSCGARG